MNMKLSSKKMKKKSLQRRSRIWLSEWESLRKATADPERKSNMSAVPTYPNPVWPLKPASRSQQLQQT
jgi:transcriptional regulator ATRX